MRKVSIIRFESSKDFTYGILKIIDKDKILFECKTIERGWLNNKPFVSCIPDGTYKVEQSYSPRFKTDLYMVLDVPKRAGIRFHSANFAKQLNGCIALGSEFKDINNDSVLDVIASRLTHKKFDEILQNLPFELEIKNWF